jgi:radical SAM protein with 4Fe4S-binding SPASM domain
VSDPFTLQLHITDACQARCRHCYRAGPVEALPVGALQEIVADFLGFCRTRRVPARVTFAGGEPLLRLDDLLALARHARESDAQAHVLTNGWLLTEDVARALKAAGCLRAQVSLDGDCAAHDALRGPGAYDKAVSALAAARRAALPATVSMTVGRWNAERLDAVIALAREHEARLFVSRLTPCGAGADLREGLLSPQEWRSVLRRCRDLARRHAPGVSLRDPLYALLRPAPARVDPMAVQGCAIGYNGLAVDADGTAYPCRRLPLALGNLRRERFETLWRSPALEALRDRDALRGRCGACARRWQCGGCRAIAHALTGDPLAADPQCPWN